MREGGRPHYILHIYTDVYVSTAKDYNNRFDRSPMYKCIIDVEDHDTSELINQLINFPFLGRHMLRSRVWLNFEAKSYLTRCS